MVRSTMLVILAACKHSKHAQTCPAAACAWRARATRARQKRTLSFAVVRNRELEKVRLVFAEALHVHLGEHGLQCRILEQRFMELLDDFLHGHFGGAEAVQRALAQVAPHVVLFAQRLHLFQPACVKTARCLGQCVRAK
jgi:hypothetical protein